MVTSIALRPFVIWEKEDDKPQAITYSLDLMTKIAIFIYLFIFFLSLD